MRLLYWWGYSFSVRTEKVTYKVLSSPKPSVILDLSAEVMNWDCAVMSILWNILKMKWTLHWIVTQLILRYLLAEVSYFEPKRCCDLIYLFFFFRDYASARMFVHQQTVINVSKPGVVFDAYQLSSLKAPPISMLARDFENESRISKRSQMAGKHFPILLIA